MKTEEFIEHCAGSLAGLSILWANKFVAICSKHFMPAAVSDTEKGCKRDLDSSEDLCCDISQFHIVRIPSEDETRRISRIDS